MRNRWSNDRNHPSIILWSDGNEEWGLENNEMGIRTAASMRQYTHLIDPTSPSTIANAGGSELIKSLDVVGYKQGKLVKTETQETTKQAGNITLTCTGKQLKNKKLVLTSK